MQNKTQTLKKSYTFLNKVCTRRGYININNSNNNNDDDDNNNNKICIYIYTYIQILKERKIFLGAKKYTSFLTCKLFR